MWSFNCAKYEKKSKEEFLRHFAKCAFLGQNWAIWPPAEGGGQNFFENLTLSLFTPYGHLTSCKVSEKLNK